MAGVVEEPIIAISTVVAVEAVVVEADAQNVHMTTMVVRHPLVEAATRISEIYSSELMEGSIHPTMTWKPPLTTAMAGSIPWVLSSKLDAHSPIPLLLPPVVDSFCRKP